MPPEPDVLEHLLRAAPLRAAPVRPHANVVQHAHGLEELDVLEGAGHPAADDPVRRSAQDALAVEEHVTGLRLVEARDHVESRRLAGAVRPDQPRDLTFLDLERHLVERDDAAEALGDVPQLE